MNIYQQLNRDEGEVKRNGKHVMYRDHLGYATLGVGRLIDERRGGGLTDEEVEYLLRNDVTRVALELSKNLDWWPSLDHVRQSALINMAFQLGINGLLNFRKTLSLIKQGDYAEAAKEALRSTWAQQTPNRARRVAQQLASGEWV